ncbi:Disease resistance protein RGA2 [Rhynchospora pubera]|uniref:Disease resistance protein RGA2 n=1 Tax=Rhynchospora pubera TaxID=906938 RepID=A0AAV8HJ67_9POAL|nr:Disease resistance protein RGA2 [Rhynchospora pubera]
MAWDLGGENVKSKLIDDLYDKAKSLVEDHLLWDNEFEEQLDNLHRQLPMVEAVLTAMNNDGLGLRKKDRLDKWSWQFRDALEAAEDVLDEIDYNKVEDELLHSTRGVLVSDTTSNNLFSCFKRKVGNLWAISSVLSTYKRKRDIFLGNSFIKKDTARRLKEVVNELDQVIKNMPTFVQLGLQSRDAKCQEHEKLLKSHEDAGLEVEPVVFGRGSEKQKIIDWLKKREDENTQSNGGNNIHAYAIVGIGGMGKTTLARLVYNDAELREVLNLNGLEVEDYLQLFNRHAFAGSNPELHEDLKIIGGDIAKKLGGCPLAAKVLGGHLNQNKQEYYWDKILKEDIRVNADTSEHGFIAILRLSYQNLPTNLQRCFKFCSIFPEDYAFEKDELIYLWIGLGLLPDKNPRLEDIGREYIDYLLRKSFFDIKESNGSTPCIVMHDLLHDLGRSLSIEECFTIGDGLDSNTNFPEMIRHLYISADATDYSLFTRIAQLKKLRTLIIVFKGGDPDKNHIPLLAEILTELKSLRVLSLTASFSCGSGGDFKKTNVEGLTNLINLRHLDVPTIIKDRIPHIGKLAALQGSINFHIQSIDGYKVTELKNLTGIRELSISQLEKVGCSESEAREVNLFKKENLRSLNLVWSMDPTRAPESDELIADVLCPPTRLRELTIKGYNGKRFPLWMKFFSDKTYFLTCISLLGCKNWSDLPELAYLPLLKTLQIKDVGLVSISKLFKAASSRTEASSSSSSPRTSSSLEILEIKYCQELKSIQLDGFKNMHSVKILIMGDCPNLTISGANAELLPPKLEHLSIGPCENLEIPIINSLLNAYSLKYLSFENCTTITTLPSTDVFATLTVLTSLKIKSCTALESLGGLEAAPSLHSLTIFGCNQLIRVSSSQLQSNGYTNQVGTRNTNSMSMLKFLNIDTETLMSIKPLRKLTTVEEIKIVNASNANPWQDLEVTMRSLKRLYLCNATWVVSLPRFLTSLQSLHICGCNAAFLQQRQNGAWSTIGSVEFCKDQCSYQKLFMSDLEFDRSDLA